MSSVDEVAQAVKSARAGNYRGALELGRVHCGTPRRCRVGGFVAASQAIKEALAIMEELGLQRTEQYGSML
jgi:hypothetical protein